MRIQKVLNAYLEIVDEHPQVVDAHLGFPNVHFGSLPQLRDLPVEDYSCGVAHYGGVHFVNMPAKLLRFLGTPHILITDKATIIPVYDVKATKSERLNVLRRKCCNFASDNVEYKEL